MSSPSVLSVAPIVFLAGALLGTLGTTPAQCTNAWAPAGNLLGTDGQVEASTMWDPDGAGPAPAQLVLGGSFALAGNVSAANLVAFDPATGSWSEIGSGTNGTVLALATGPNGELVVGGMFTSAGGMPSPGLATWNGIQWSPLGSGLGGPDTTVEALLSMPNGDLVAGGLFTMAGGVPADGVARWNGTTWSPMGAGLRGIRALAALTSGDVVAGGAFTTAIGAPADLIARFDGASWLPMGSGLGTPNGPGQSVHALTVLPNGDLVAGGTFHTSGALEARGVALWDGTAWSPLGSNGDLTYALAHWNGDLIRGGEGRVARWIGATSNWVPLGTGFTGVARVHALTELPNGHLMAAGSPPLTGSMIVQWDGAAWSPLANPWWNGRIDTMAALPNGGVVVGGPFTCSPGGAANRIAQWDGKAWSPLGSGFNVDVRAVAALPNGDIVASADFAPSHRLARWNGTTWSPIGPPVFVFPGLVSSLLVLPDGGIVAGGSFTTPANNIALWNGASWSPFGAGTNGQVSCMARLPNGDIVAGGNFTMAGGVPAISIARWDGTSWSALGAGIPPSLFDAVRALTVLPDGDIVAGGLFTTAGGVTAQNIARWDGASWWPLGTGLEGGLGVDSLVTLPGGDLIAGGTFYLADGLPAPGIARWNGTSWSALGAGTDLPFVTALLHGPGGDLLVGGSFTFVDDAISPYMARLTTTCPAAAVPFGLGCPGSGGNNSLTAVTLPWVESTFRARASGLPASAIVVQTWSKTPLPQALAPLTLLFPQAGPGCDALVFPDILQATLADNGTAQSELFLPNVPPLVGATFYHQMVPIEFDAQGNWVAVTATNALQLTAGMF